MKSQSAELTIFYDSLCPLCTSEMDKLRALDKNEKLAFVSLQDDSETTHYPDLNISDAMTVLHGQLPDGTYLKGLDVTHKAWSVVGRGYLTAVLRLPVLRWLFDKMYLVFAKHRYRVSSMLTGRAYNEACIPCSEKRCDVRTTKSDQSRRILPSKEP